MATPTPRPVPPPGDIGAPDIAQQLPAGLRPAPAPAPGPRPAAMARPVAPASKPTATAPKPSRADRVIRGRLKAAHRMMFYGVEGVGKSSLAADAPGPLFFDVEGGSNELEAPRYAFRDDENGHVPATYAELLAGVDDLRSNDWPGVKTLVVDTIDAVEAMIHRHICARDKQTGIEGYGYGKGYRVALEEMRDLLRRLDDLRRKNISIVFLGHSFVSPFKNPEGEDYDRYWPRLHKDVMGQVKEWCDVVGFVHFEGGGAKLTGDSSQAKRARGWSTGRRLVELDRTAAWDAKSRLSLPTTLELAREHPWHPFGEARRRATEATPDSLRAEIAGELERITGGAHAAEFTTPTGQVTTGLVILDIATDNDASVLERVLVGLKSTASIIATEES